MDRKDILAYVSCIPRKMLSIQDCNNVAEFVLHDLCNEHCYNIPKAAYFVDNPDFNWLKGVAGFYKGEAYKDENIWGNPSVFSDHMKQAEFNQKIRGISKNSPRCKGSSCEPFVQEIAQECGIKEPAFCEWQLKNNNHGLLVYECNDVRSCEVDDYLNGLSILAFCPIS